MRKAKSRSPPRKPQKSSSLPQLKRTYYAPLRLCSVNLSKHTYSCNDVRLGVVEKREQRRLPFMHVDRADDSSQTVPKLPSLSKIMNSIQRMKLTDKTKAQSMDSLHGSALQSSDFGKQSGSLRLNPLFGGSGPFRGGPRLPIKRKRFAPGETDFCHTRSTLAKVKLPRSRPTSGKKGKRAAWAKESETQPLGISIKQQGEGEGRRKKERILRKGEVEKLIDEMFSYATVSWEEWMSFLEKYREVDEQHLRDEFASADSDGNEMLDIDELNELLKKLGYIIDVDLRRFEKLREHLRCTEGADAADAADAAAIGATAALTAEASPGPTSSSSERSTTESPTRPRHEEICAGSQQDIAKKLIAEQQEMPVEDIWRIIQYLGYQITFERELLKLIARIRAAEREAIAAVFEALAEDGTRLHVNLLPHALAELRRLSLPWDRGGCHGMTGRNWYFVTDDMEKFILQNLRLKGRLVLGKWSEPVAFLNMYRDKDGLTPPERRELDALSASKQDLVQEERMKLELFIVLRGFASSSFGREKAELGVEFSRLSFHIHSVALLNLFGRAIVAFPSRQPLMFSNVQKWSKTLANG
eukprot:Skav204369  [mRNA]  locus=scaffold866:116170:125507:+ [translate_table: standard]